MALLDTSKPVYLIINPRSGSGMGRGRLAQLRNLLACTEFKVVEYTTTGPGDATDYAASIAQEASLVMVWGGDGTINEVANALGGTEVPILPIPAGTENLLSKELRLARNPQVIVDSLSTGRLVHCDLGQINGRQFLLIVGIGFDGEVIRRLSAARTGHISYLSYFWPIWRTFLEHDFPMIRVTVDGEEIFDGRGLAFVGNISRYAVGLRIVPDARFDDGLLDVLVFPCQHKHWLLWHAAWTLMRMHPQKGYVITRQGRSIQIESAGRPVACQADGEVGPFTPIDVSLTGKQIAVLVPKPRGGWDLLPWEK
jgi:diacylglycerol kinase (ATP)